MNDFGGFVKYQYSVLSVSQAINSTVRGTTNRVSDESLLHYTNWLDWRITEAWSDSVWNTEEEYDGQVRRLAISSVRMAKEYFDSLEHELLSGQVFHSLKDKE